MHKKWLAFTACALLTLTCTTSAYAAGEEASADKKTTGKHNFDQWQTIKRLQVTR